MGKVQRRKEEEKRQRIAQAQREARGDREVQSRYFDYGMSAMTSMLMFTQILKGRRT